MGLIIIFVESCKIPYAVAVWYCSFCFCVCVTAQPTWLVHIVFSVLHPAWGNPYAPSRFLFFFQAEDGIRDFWRWLEFRRVLFRSILHLKSNSAPEWYWSTLRSKMVALISSSSSGIPFASRIEKEEIVRFFQSVTYALNLAVNFPNFKRYPASKLVISSLRSEERRVGKECRCRWEGWR